jgi:hypothetical protein
MQQEHLYNVAQDTYIMQQEHLYNVAQDKLYNAKRTLV